MADMADTMVMTQEDEARRDAMLMWNCSLKTSVDTG